MATSAINFQGNLTLNSDLNRGEAEFEFRPPSSIAGKVCYVDVRAFALSWDETYDTAQPYHSYVLRASWPQMQSGSVETASTGLARQETAVDTDVEAPTTTTATSTYTKTGNTTDTSLLIAGLPDVTNLYVGMTVTGTPIRANTTITQIFPITKQVLISNTTTAASTGATFTFSNGYDIVVTSATDISVGMAVSGTGIASGTTVTSIFGTVVTLSANTTATTSGNINFYPYTIAVEDPKGLKTGMIVAGLAALNGATVTAISGSTVTLSTYITAGIANQTKIAFVTPSTGYTQRTNSPPAILNYSSMTSQSVPVLVHIPRGPDTVRFSVTRMDMNIIGKDTSDISMMALMSIVPADSRQPPIV